MIKILIVSSRPEDLSALAEAFSAEAEVAVSWAESGREALAAVNQDLVHLVVAGETLGDMTGFQLARGLVLANPFTNCALVSSLSSEHFHAASEGFGLLDQLPPRPGPAEAKELLDKLRKIQGLV